MEACYAYEQVYNNTLESLGFDVKLCHPLKTKAIAYPRIKTDNRCKDTCCPADSPIYDPTSGNCIKEASVNTRSVGNCAVLQTTLETAFTDVTFANDAG